MLEDKLDLQALMPVSLKKQPERIFLNGTGQDPALVIDLIGNLMGEVAGEGITKIGYSFYLMPQV
jgi:hypothetical protein